MAKKDYLLDAAQQIRMALDREVNEDYEAAFSYYKNGVDLLLNGVQVDPNKERREAVKRKTTQYLKRAEEIFISYLQDNIAKGSTHLGGYSSLRFRSIRHLSSPVENLAKCKVVGIIDKVLTVESLISKETFIVKSLPKSSWESRERSTIIPQGVPFMVKLLKYYVSEDTVFLHLEHVQGGRLFSRLHRVRSEAVREHPECFSPNQHKIYLKNSYTLPALHQEIYLNENYGRTKPLESPDSPTKHCLENCPTHSYCEDSGRQQGGSLGLYATRKDNELPSVGLSNGLKSLPQDNIPLPIHPCVIVDTRDPLDVTSDLLGNDVRIERIDSCIDLNKAWNALEPAQDCLSFTVPESNSDILGFTIASQITPASLFGENAQPTLCSTVDVLPQRVRIVPNTSHLPPQNQARDGFPHEQGVTNCKHSGNEQISQFMAELNKVSSHRNPFECTPQKQESISLDFSKMTSRVNTVEMVREIGKEDMENWQFFSSSSKQPQVGMISCLSAPTPNSSCWSETELEQQVKVDGLDHHPQIKATNFSAKSKWGRLGLPEDEVRLWGAQILLALESLHEQGIVCQDLNPRNILLRNSGEACLTYFGLWTEVQPEINPKAMEEMYCAPEIGGASKITEACDWWSLGALLYELLTGTPLWQCHPTGVHPHTPLHIPEFLSTAAASLLTELLQFDACYRLGSGGGGVSDIKCHPFFSSIPWLTLSSSLTP
ncbi:ribosomal protein S6 kinase-like 1 [Cyprinus carpio]|uniref:Ribosomal protein S6 kinase-like 1 n=1 Tax=Cyprinus carpio TaxID=7962 RepID=A0A8C1WLN9_CYPCA|nr:ribosomal protein S6 kinase-like 1 [Cyprinus carpio]XP_042610793.1 ribosomal protein S6 kinase-like 1 [Cyprinus carpio]XP_042610794.1 ribosomal protein S6 kinase-like 1 [Cyprinus carpio]XP_042610795.1 ribosomal protein S6 kinase-like 1 [Cyprinus carpio]XP_042610796.1 ribosomal protein S6 kinase-like 1 [Cyprinus carpio]XP_042610797.1 ribosomal protein S6 kinase-like 1 [Cyprinus carpio]